MMRYVLLVVLLTAGLICTIGCDQSTTQLAAKMAGLGDLLQTQDQIQLQDGSCNDCDGTPDRLQTRARDNSYAKIADQDQIRLQLRDGSCK